MISGVFKRKEERKKVIQCELALLPGGGWGRVMDGDPGGRTDPSVVKGKRRVFFFPLSLAIARKKRHFHLDIVPGGGEVGSHSPASYHEDDFLSVCKTPNDPPLYLYASPGPPGEHVAVWRIVTGGKMAIWKLSLRVGGGFMGSQRGRCGLWKGKGEERGIEGLI